MNLLARNAGHAAYQKATALYEGQAKARLMNLQASADEYSGQLEMEDAKRTRQAANFAATGTLMKTGASLYSIYAGDGPKKIEKFDTPDSDFEWVE